MDRAQETNLLENFLLFFNQGNDSTADEQGAAAAGAIALDDKFAGEPYQVSTFSLAYILSLTSVLGVLSFHLRSIFK